MLGYVHGGKNVGVGGKVYGTCAYATRPLVPVCSIAVHLLQLLMTTPLDAFLTSYNHSSCFERYQVVDLRRKNNLIQELGDQNSCQEANVDAAISVCTRGQECGSSTQDEASIVGAECGLNVDGRGQGDGIFDQGPGVEETNSWHGKTAAVEETNIWH